MLYYQLNRIITRINFIIRISFILILYFSLVANSSAKDSLVLSSTLEYDETNCVTNILKKAYEDINYSLSFIHHPSARGLLESNSGRVDGVTARRKAINEEYQKLIRVGPPICPVEIVAFSKIKYEFDSVRDFENLVIGYKRGTEVVEKIVEGIPSSPFLSYEGLLKRLNLGHIDIAIGSRRDMTKIITEKKYGQILLLKPKLAQNPLYHFLHSKHRYLIPLVNKSLMGLLEKGYINKAKKEDENRYVIPKSTN